MTHHHDHGGQSADAPLSFPEKAIKLLNHWIQHNHDHAESYRKWAGEFRGHDLGEAAGLLEIAAELTAQINHTLNQAVHHIQS